MFRMKFGLIVLVFHLIATFASYAQEKKLTADDVSKIESAAWPGRLQELTYRQTKTNLIIRGSQSPVQLIQIYESAPPNSLHIFQIELVKGRMERIDYFRIGSKVYNKEADGTWVVSDIESKPSFRMPETESSEQVLDRVNSNKVTIEPTLAAALAEAAAEDKLIARSDPNAKATTVFAPAVGPTENVETVDVKYEPDKLLDKALTNFYEVTRHGTTGSGKSLLGYTMIKRVWINKNGTLARTEFESTNTFVPWTQLITDVYDYDSTIKIVAPIK